MSWHDEIASALPPPAPGCGPDQEPTSLRQDILDELADHLDCAVQRELRRTDDVDLARKSALARFGNPARIARRLWLDAMKETVMNQRILLGTNLAMLALIIGLVIIVVLSQRQNQAVMETLVEKMGAFTIVTAPPSASPEDIASFSWPRAVISVEGDGPQRLSLAGEPYNPGEKITLHANVVGGAATFGPMRPGRYRLNASDARGLSHQRIVIVPPGADHRELLYWPPWSEQRVPVRVSIDLPEDIVEREPHVVVYLRSSLAGMRRTHQESLAVEQGSWTGPQFVIHIDPEGGQAVAPWVDGGTPTSPPDLARAETVELDAAFEFQEVRIALIFPVETAREGHVLIWLQSWADSPPVWRPDDLRSGEVRITPGEDSLAGLRNDLARIDRQQPRPAGMQPLHQTQPQ